MRLVHQSSTWLLAAALGCMSLPAAAQRTAPGLWELKIEQSHTDGEIARQLEEAKRQMAAMPPEARAMMEQMLSRQGLSLDGDGGISVRVCITPEEAERAGVPEHDENCDYEVLDRSSDRLRVRLQCRDEGRTRGEGEIRFDGDRAYRGSFDIESRIDGKPMRMTMRQQARWLREDCSGAIGR